MEIKRRNLLTEPGDTLLLSKSSLEALTRFSSWIEATGMSSSEFTANTLCAVPLPLYPVPEPGKRRFSNVKPEVMWHPLFWLPTRVGGQYRLASATAEGEFEPESESVRSARIAMELTASGLFDSTTGGWVDIMDTVGINVDDANDLRRISTWQAGRPDEVLDSIDLTDYMHVEKDPNWALESTVQMLDQLEQAQWAILADSLVELIDDAAQPVSGAIDLTDLRTTTALAAFLASSHLHAVPSDTPVGSADFWDRLETEAKTGLYRDAGHFLDGPAAEASAWLYATTEKYWASVEELQSMGS